MEKHNEMERSYPYNFGSLHCAVESAIFQLLNSKSLTREEIARYLQDAIDGCDKRLGR